MLSVERRSSPVGRWYQPPSCAVVLATVGAVVPVRPAPLIVICVWFFCALARRKNTFRLAVLAGPPLVWTSSAAMFDSASRAASTSLAVALNAIGAVVWPSQVRV